MNIMNRNSKTKKIVEKKKFPYLKVIGILQNVIPMILYPILVFYLFEWYIHNPWTDMKVPIQFLNIFLYELLMLLLFFLFGKLKTALRIETVFFMVIGLANYYVLEFRSAPIMPWDIFSLGTAASVADNFKYTLEKETVFVLIGFVLLLIIQRFVNLEIKKPQGSSVTPSNTGLFAFFKNTALLRGLGTLVCVLLLCGFTHMLHQDDTISHFKMYDKLFTPTTMSKRDGTAVAFLMELKYVSVDKPEGYRATEAKELLASYEPDSVDATANHSPNIIVIMNEAFSDPAVLGDFETNEDYMPYVHSLLGGEIENTISGYLNVSVLGGNTANTEFEFLTGNTMAFLPQGSIPYQQYIKNELPSMASHLKNMGYSTIAMHPYNSSGWDRDTVYPLLGFDTSYFIRDWTNPHKIRKYVSDEACYDKIIELYEEKDTDTPFFVFNVTMQNHSSYSEEFDNFTPDITVTGSTSKILPNYLSLMKISDEAIQDLIAYFSQDKEDTVIVFFGDHQPTNSVVSPVWKLNGKSSDSLTEEEESLRYKVPFFIWSNYAMETVTGVETSANYLGGMVLEAAKLPLDSMHNYLQTIEQQFPVISAIRAENNAGISTEIKEVKKALNTYACLQYYSLFDIN